jgi:hypothetical protein
LKEKRNRWPGGRLGVGVVTAQGSFCWHRSRSPHAAREIQMLHLAAIHATFVSWSDKPRNPR